MQTVERSIVSTVVVGRIIFIIIRKRFLRTFLKKERDIILNRVMDKTIFNSTRATYLVLFLCMLLGMGATKIVTSLLGGQKLLGYGFPSVSAATSAGVSFVNEMPTALYHYRKNADGDVDDFYTINPAVEVNLSGGPIPPREARQGEYVYQGIFCYVWTGGAPRNRKRVETSGKAYNTGEVDRNGWYQYNQTWSKARYHDEPEATPAQEGWGDPNNAELISTNANFEWFYGKNGAVKAAMPRFLGFHDCFEGQFVYYLYDTSFLSMVPSMVSTLLPQMLRVALKEVKQSVYLMLGTTPCTMRCVKTLG